jgi:hypothetical protein
LGFPPLLSLLLTLYANLSPLTLCALLLLLLLLVVILVDDHVLVLLALLSWLATDDTEGELSIPRQEWLATLFRDQPEVLRLYHQMRPFLKEHSTEQDEEALSFSRQHPTSTTEYKHHLSYDSVLQLIMEHLHAVGYVHTAKAIEEESRVPCMLPCRRVFCALTSYCCCCCFADRSCFSSRQPYSR